MCFSLEVSILSFVLVIRGYFHVFEFHAWPVAGDTMLSSGERDN